VNLLESRASNVSFLCGALIPAAYGIEAQSQDKQQKIDIDWSKTVMVSKSTPKLQVVTNPMLNPGSAIRDGSFTALKTPGAAYVRYVPWLPYPNIAVAELARWPITPWAAGQRHPS
jgi:hypothetical protein